MTGPKGYLSLREIGRRLGIPPSSVVYYKDRFQGVIPHEGGDGRRRKYPELALTMFKEIREMFDNNHSAEQIEEALREKYAAILSETPGCAARHEQPMSSGAGPAAEERGLGVADLAGVLDKMSTLLEAQNHFRDEMTSLRAEVLELRREREAMEREMEAIRAERDQWRRVLYEHLDSDRSGQGAAEGGAGNDTDGGAGREGARAKPSAEVFGRPLVILSAKGEFLGVAGRGRHFNLNEFIHLIRQGGEPGRTVAVAWERLAGDPDATWRLRLKTSDPGEGLAHEHVLDLKPVVTPSGNKVVRLARMLTDGGQVPEEFLMVLFKRIRENLGVGAEG